VRHDLGLSATKNRFPQKGTCLAIYSRVVNTQETLAEVLKTTSPWCAPWEAELKQLFRGYVEAKQVQNVLDYDDLLLFLLEMAGEPTLAAQLGAHFNYVLVDEYQDTIRLQASILECQPNWTANACNWTFGAASANYFVRVRREVVGRPWAADSSQASSDPKLPTCSSKPANQESACDCPY
jgi:hypothetical protein